MSKKKKMPKTSLEIYQTIRRDWNGVNPVTKVFKDKTKYQRHPKHKNKEMEGLNLPYGGLV